MHPCQPVGPDYFQRAPYRFVAEQLIAATPEAIFESFECAEDWPRWAPVIRRVVWTCDKPYRVGSTRTVHMIGLVADEVFIAWERGREMAFCFTAISEPAISAFGEHYRVEDLGDGRCRVRWTMAMTPEGAGRWGLKLFGPLLGLGLRLMLWRFRRLLEARGR